MADQKEPVTVERLERALAFWVHLNATPEPEQVAALNIASDLEEDVPDAGRNWTGGLAD
jgi:hypothetical protein